MGRPRVLVLGGSGMLGWVAAQALADRTETWATYRGTPPASAIVGGVRPIVGVDALSPGAIERAISACAADVVVNAIGLVPQRAEADDPALVIALNALLPHRVAAACAATGARLIHVSTDCVFSGERGGYTEDDRPDPVDLYGRAKLLGEVSSPHAVTLRTSLVGRELASAHSLVEWFLSQRGRVVGGYAGAIFSGLSTRAFAAIVARLATDGPALHGLWHVSVEPVSKYQLLTWLNERAAADVRIVRDDSVRCDRSLDSARFWQETGFARPRWPEMIDDLVASPTEQREPVAAGQGG